MPASRPPRTPTAPWVAGLLGGLRVSQLDTDGITDRAYRLHFNQGQNRVDLFAQIGSVLGLAAAAALTGLRGPAITCLGGAAAWGRCGSRWAGRAA